MKVFEFSISGYTLININNSADDSLFDGFEKFFRCNSNKMVKILNKVALVVITLCGNYFKNIEFLSFLGNKF